MASKKTGNCMALLFIFFSCQILGGTEHSKAKLAITYDLGDHEFEKAFHKAISHSSVKDEVGQTYLYAFDHALENNAQLMKEYLTNLTFNFLLDFTRTSNNTEVVREFVAIHQIPTLSVNRLAKRTWVSQNPNISNKYLVLAASPNSFAQIIAQSITTYTPERVLISCPIGKFVGDLRVLLISNPNQISNQYAKQQRVHGQVANYSYPINFEPSKPLDLLNNYGVSTFLFIGSHADTYKFIQSVAKFETDRTLLVDGKPQDIRKLSSVRTNLFTERFSWWSISTIVNDSFTCPNYVNHVAHLNFRTTTPVEGLESSFTEYKTHNLNDLFVVDVVHNAIKSYVQLAKNGKWSSRKTTEFDPKFDFDWQTDLDKLFLQDSNLLGKYDVGNNWVAPRLSVDVDYITPSKVVKYGELMRVWDKGYLITPYNSILRIRPIQAINYIAVCVVVDKRFIWKLDSFNSTMAEKLASFGNYFGLAKDLIQPTLNATFAKMYFVSEESEYGELDEKTQTWSGGIGVLQKNEADMILGLVEDDTNLKSVVDMSAPFLRQISTNKSVGIVFRKDYNPIALQSINNFILSLKPADVKRRADYWFPGQTFGTG